MKHIALHILQPFPATCLNRDDVGAPKNLIFGGATRARVSSQCWKRQIRLLARLKAFTDAYGNFSGERTLRAAEDLAKILAGAKVEEAESLAKFVCDSFLSSKVLETTEDSPDGIDEEEAEVATGQTSTLLYFSPGELAAIAQAVSGLDAAVRGTALKVAPKGDKKAAKEIQKNQKTIRDAASKAVKGFTRSDAADIAIFGRMVANDSSLTIEGAGLFAHAFSTHKCDNDLDFWTAVDDRKGDEPGAANMGHAEFNAACYYRYIALNLDLLADSNHLQAVGKEGRQQIARTFLRATLLAVPTAKQNSMNGHSLPEFALGLVSTGQPFQLANAFEKPVQAKGEGWLQPSVEALERHFGKLKTVFSLEAFEGEGDKRARTEKSLIREEVRLSQETPLDTFIEKLVAHVY
jgi:CRISPR system Cascade subunit CasC